MKNYSRRRRGGVSKNKTAYRTPSRLKANERFAHFKIDKPSARYGTRLGAR